MAVRLAASGSRCPVGVVVHVVRAFPDRDRRQTETESSPPHHELRDLQEPMLL